MSDKNSNGCVREESWRCCRDAFIAMIREENTMSYGCKQSLRKSWAGEKKGFADEKVQQRYRDFQKGWDAHV